MSRPLIHSRKIIFLLVLAMAGGAIFLLNKTSGGNLSSALIESIFSREQTAPPSQGGDEGEVEMAARPYVDEAGRYIHKDPGFSFAAPDGDMPVSNNIGDGWEVVTAKNFQISIYPHDEPAITPERIKLDVPDIVIENIQYATLDGAEALVFNSNEATIGETYEVWFVHGEYLYQAMTYAGKAEELNEVLNTWKFMQMVW